MAVQAMDGGQSHSMRFARALVSEFDGQIKILDLVKSTFSTTYFATSNKNYKNVSNALGDVKVALNFGHLPFEFPSLLRRYRSTVTCISDIRQKRKRSEKVTSKDYIRVANRCAGIVKKILSIMGDGFFKPAIIIDKSFCIGGPATQIGKAWKVLATIKSGVKAFSDVTKLAAGAKKVSKKIFDLIIELTQMILGILQMSYVKVHPAIFVTLNISKSLFGLYEIWVDTA